MLTRIPPQRETGLPGGNLTSPKTVQISDPNQDQYNPAEGGEVIFTCPSCGSDDLTSLWGGNYLDTLTVCRTCCAKHAEDPDVTIHFPEFCPDYAAYAPYSEPAAAPAEVAA